MKKVSIICTNFNKGPWLSEALDSFIRQNTNFDFEIIIIDDASTDRSMEVINKYANRYPNLITVITNSQNLGIARTWIKACKYAKGQYIARCDGDDFWTDSDKLQKQVDLLEKTPDSKWSNTDFDFVDSSGEVIHSNAFKTAYIPLTDTYEKMLTLKGMTMSSTWLVETSLMQEVNETIDLNTVDDTFELQLELFRRTNLSFLEDSTTVYRMTQNSDSRPRSEAKMKSRIEGLLKTQLSFLAKYPNQDTSQMVTLLLEHDANQEWRIHELSEKISDCNQILQEKEVFIHNQNQSYTDLLSQYHEKIQEIEHLTHRYNCIVTSRRWQLTSKIIDFFRRSK